MLSKNLETWELATEHSRLPPAARKLRRLKAFATSPGPYPCGLCVGKRKKPHNHLLPFFFPFFFVCAINSLINSLSPRAQTPKLGEKPDGVK